MLKKYHAEISLKNLLIRKLKYLHMANSQELAKLNLVEEVSCT